MAKSDKDISTVVESISESILLLRGQKVMLDFSIAEFYGVQTKTLNQAVRRNLERFPEDFMFQLTKQEVEALRSQIVTLKGSGVFDSRSQIATSNEINDLTALKRPKKGPIIPILGLIGGGHESSIDSRCAVHKNSAAGIGPVVRESASKFLYQ